MEDSISVIICAFNEEKSIKKAVTDVLKAVSKEVADYEIIVVDDGSSDRTGGLAKQLAKKNKRIKAVSHERNLGFGMAYRTGIAASSKYYIAGYPSDADLPIRFFRDIIAKRKEADVVSSYLTNMGDRTLSRRIFSLSFTYFMNFLFGLHLRYFNGYFICRGNLLKSLDLKSEGFTLFAEVKIRLLKKGATIYEVPILFAPRKYGSSKALRRKNFLQIFKIIPLLIKDVCFSARVD